MSFLAPIAGAVIGGLMSDGGGGQQQTATKEPWEPARKPLTNSLSTGQDLERYYQQNPFNPLQRQGYQNLYSDLDQFRNQMAPGLMNFANRLMNTNYQRGQQPMQYMAPQASVGLLAPPQQAVFQAPTQGSYGLLDFRQLNPFTADNGIPKEPEKKPTDQEMEEERRRKEEKAALDAYMASERGSAGA